MKAQPKKAKEITKTHKKIDWFFFLNTKEKIT